MHSGHVHGQMRQMGAGESVAYCSQHDSTRRHGASSSRVSFFEPFVFGKAIIAGAAYTLRALLRPSYIVHLGVACAAQHLPRGAPCLLILGPQCGHGCCDLAVQLGIWQGIRTDPWMSATTRVHMSFSAKLGL